MPRLRSPLCRFVSVVVPVLASSVPAVASAATYTYTPSPTTPTGLLWSDPTTWSPTGVPGPGDTAIVNLSLPASTLEADGVTVMHLTISGTTASEIIGTGITVEAGGTFDWQGGRTAAPITLLAGATSTIGSGTYWLDGAKLTNWGNLSWTDGQLLGDQGAVFENDGALVITAGTTGFGYGQGTNSSDFTNKGTLTLIGTGTVTNGAATSAEWGFHNSGTVSLGAGTTLDWQTAANTQHTLDGGGTITGMGTLLFDEPDITQNFSVLTLNGTTTVAAGATLSIATGAQVNAGSAGATLTGSGTLLWTGGQLVASSAGGTDNMQPSVTWGPNLRVHLTGSAIKDLAGAYVISGAPVTWDAGPLGFDSHGYFTNNGTFTVAGDLAVNPTTPGVAATLENHGTFIKSSGTGTLGVNSVTVLNYGTIDGASGTLSLVTTSGTADVLEAGSTLKDSVVATCEVSLSGTSTVAAGSTFELGNDGMGDQALLDGSGTLDGPGTVKIDGASIVASGAATLTFASAVTLTANNVQSLFTADNPPSAITFAGATSWTGGDLEIWDGTVINSGMWTTTAAATLTNNGGGSLFSNTGTFTSNPGTGATLGLLAPFTNAGAVVLESGTTQFGGSGYVQTAGSIMLSGGGVTTQDLDTPTDYNAFDIQGGTLGGVGTVDAPVTCEGTVAPGTSSAAGTLSVTQTYTQSATGKLTVSLGGTTAGSEFDVLAVSGTVTLDGTLAVGLLGAYEPAVGDTYKVITSGEASSLSGTFASVAMPPGVQLTATYDPSDVTLDITAVSLPMDAGVDGGSGSGTGGSGTGTGSGSATDSGSTTGGSDSGSHGTGSGTGSRGSGTGGSPDAGVGGHSSSGDASQSGSCALVGPVGDQGSDGWPLLACACVLGATAARRRRAPGRGDRTRESAATWDTLAIAAWSRTHSSVPSPRVGSHGPESTFRRMRSRAT